MILEVNHINKVYKSRGHETIALRDVDFSVQENEFVAIMGESGSGKSTLLNILATFDQPSQGQVLLKDQDLAQIKSNELAKFRREQLGFVFQDSALLDSFTNKDNILLPLVLSNVSQATMQERLSQYAKFLGIGKFLDKFPYEVSGGQQQRVAIARALINQPKILLADEPTGALDSKNSDQIMKVFKAVNQAGNTILMVTHSIRAASAASRILFIRDGIIFHELYRGQQSDQEFQERIADSMSLVSQRGV